jgi:hypothetical protein
MNQLVETILRGISERAEHQVGRVVEQYRDRVRDSVKDAAMLSFTKRGQARHQVNLRIISGAPDVVMDTFLEDELGTALTAYREPFRRAAECLGALERISAELSEDTRHAFLRDCPADAARDVETYLRQMVDRIDKAAVTHRILSVDGDPLGSYQPSSNSGTITLYWQMIALCASQLDISTEALTLKVLSHEYAHALCHLGMDAEGGHWELDRFWGAERPVHEGLANYLSWWAMQSSTDWLMREATAALEAIWPRQPAAYHEFDVWRTRKVRAETVRTAMREARTWSLVEAERFRELLGIGGSP